MPCIHVTQRNFLQEGRHAFHLIHNPKIQQRSGPPDNPATRVPSRPAKTFPSSIENTPHRPGDMSERFCMDRQEMLKRKSYMHHEATRLLLLHCKRGLHSLSLRRRKDLIPAHIYNEKTAQCDMAYTHLKGMLWNSQIQNL